MTGDLVTDHRAIAMRYLSGWFTVDLLATFPVDYIVRAVEVRRRSPVRNPCRAACCKTVLPLRQLAQQLEGCQSVLRGAG